MSDDTKLTLALTLCALAIILPVAICMDRASERHHETIVKLVLAGATPAEARDSLR